MAYENYTTVYSGLNERKLRECLEENFTPEQLAKANKRELAKLDEKINAMTLTRRGMSPGRVRELRLVLLGKTGAGKSSVGNMIVGRSAFKESFGSKSCTSTIEQAASVVDNIPIQLIDTPGLIDTSRSTESILTELAKVVESFSNGIHGFLFVFNFGNPRFTAEEKEAFRQIEQGLFGPKFLDHCFVVITNGKNLYMKTNLATYLEEERDSDFGKLLNDTVKRRVIVVENSEETMYGRREQRLQVIRMIAANMHGTFTNDAIMEYKADQEAIARSYQENIQSLAPVIEDALFDELKSLPHEELKDLSPAMRAAVVDRALKKVMQHEKARPGMERQIQDALTVALPQKIKRLTSTSFLSKVKHFGMRLLKVAGVLTSIATIFA